MEFWAGTADCIVPSPSQPLQLKHLPKAFALLGCGMPNPTLSHYLEKCFKCPPGWWLPIFTWDGNTFLVYPPPHAFLLVGKWAGWCCYEDLTGNFVVRTEWFSSVEKDKAFVWGWSKTILLPSYLSLDFTFALLYLKRFQKHLNVKLMTKSEAKC